MSDKNCNLPCEHHVESPLLLANRGQLLDIDGNYTMSLSPDSAGCTFNLNDGGDCSSPDINTLCTVGPMMQPSIGLTQRRLSNILENSFITTSDNSSTYLLDDSFSMLSNQDSGDDGRSSSVVSPDSVGMSSCGMSCRGSVDLSFSSGEMIARCNSFILEEQAVPLLLSSLEGSPAPMTTSHTESKLLFTPMSEQECAGDLAYPGTTFVFGDSVELPSLEDAALCGSSLALPSEKAGIQSTFLCENSAADWEKETHFIDSEAEMLNESNTPEMPNQMIFDTPVVQDKDILSALCETATEEKGVSMSPHPVEMNVCRLSSQGYMDLSCCTGEMVVRSNSFILEEQAVTSALSALEETPTPLVTSHTKSKVLLTPMSEKEGAGINSCLGMTFVLGGNIELPSVEDAAMCSSVSALPDDRANLLSTFLCENSQADCANEARFFHSEAEILNETHAPETPIQSILLDAPFCAVQDEDICTSTPLQIIGCNMPSLPSFAMSPCTENTGSPAFKSVLRNRNPVTPKQFERGISNSHCTKITKMESRNFTDAASSSALLDKPILINKKSEEHKGGSFRPSPARSSGNNRIASNVSKAVSSPRRPNLQTDKPQSNLQKSPNSEEIKMKNKTLAHSPAAHCSSASPNAKRGTSSLADPKPCIANATFCYPEKSQKTNKSSPKPTPKNIMTDKIKKEKSVCHDKSAFNAPNFYPCSSSESMPRHFKMPAPQKLSACVALSKFKTENLKCQNKQICLGTSSPSRVQGATMEATDVNNRKVKKTGLVANACSTPSNTRVCGQAFSNQTSRTLTPKSVAASPRMTTPLNKQRPGTFVRESCRTTAAVTTPLSKQKPTDSRKATGQTSLAATPAARSKPASSQHLQTTPRPSRPSLMGSPSTPVLRQQTRKASGLTRNQNKSTVHSESSGSARTTQVSGVAGRRQTPLKVTSVLTSSCKSAATSGGLPISPPKRTTTAKLIRFSTPVDKSKPKVGAHPQQQQHGERGTSRPQQKTGGTQALGPRGVTKVQIQQAQLTQSNIRFEAFTVVLQRTLAQRDEAVRQNRGLSQELLELRGELMNTVNRSEGLAQEKEALKASLQEALDQVQAQHQRDLLELEQRLREQHQIELSTAQQKFREEAERHAERLHIQMEELSADHKAMKQDLETLHSQQLQNASQQHQLSLQELRNAHTQELQSLNKTLKDVEMVLNEKIRELTQENAALMERLAEENKTRDISQKDTHKVYLERELESLNVVLDIKTEQLHQQEKKLMEVDKLTETNVKLEETLRKVQQENEDLKARMDRHAALSRQLSTEQALLQESLQKESKVNKRLSMENEELLWKLHNGDLSSPRKSSPNPPSPHFSLQSPRAASLFSSPPVSPR